MKRMVVLHTDGTETVLNKVPTLKAMQKLVGGYIEQVAVLDRVDKGIPTYTYMFVNEEGLISGLPRNEKATELYQRNARWQFPDARNPFKAIKNAALERDPEGATVIYDMDEHIGGGYESDPWIAGTAIYFEGYTIREVNHLMGDDA